LSEGGVCMVGNHRVCVFRRQGTEALPLIHRVGPFTGVGVGGGRRACQRKGTGSRFPDRDGGTRAWIQKIQI